MFPLLRPDSPEFDAWLEARAATDVTHDLIEEAGGFLSAAERERIACAHAMEFPAVWRSLLEDYGDEAEAKQAVVVGAIVAALGEAARTVDPTVLELIEECRDVRNDPAEALALVLEATDLWSVAEATAVDDALAEIPDDFDDDAYELLWTATIEAQASRLWSPRHERRLVRLVERLAAQLPDVESADASAVLTAACAAFERNDGLRPRLAAMLLADSLGWLRRADLTAIAA
jgi:hypothetical protein